MISTGISLSARPGTGATDRAPLQLGYGAPTFPSTSAKDLHIHGSDSSSRECTADDLARGTKRKYDEYKNETHMLTRQKICSYTHTVIPRGVKRKFASDHSEQPRKRFKATPPEDNIGPSENETEPSVSNSTSDEGSNSVLNIGSSDTYSDDSKDISDSQPAAGASKDLSKEESRDAKIEKSEDGISFPRSCVCNVGHSKLR
ncbi:uncharacterized protein LOC128547071 [Mercenaria mercenaria]|uniref:uncharacterized protein LOC128547071 n=1 Tax=Mercenaria mercenaria TaxID=6596 RepID=UPI00234F176B|nr:uncharacterized protein LOC128547071 [Mercenaria mercenaria]